MTTDKDFMLLALEQARLAWGQARCPWGLYWYSANA